MPVPVPEPRLLLISCSRKSWILASNRLYSGEGRGQGQLGPAPEPHPWILLQLPTHPSKALAYIHWPNPQVLAPPSQLTLGLVLGHNGDALPCILEGDGRLLMCRTAQVHTVHLPTHVRMPGSLKGWEGSHDGCHTQFRRMGIEQREHKYPWLTPWQWQPTRGRQHHHSHGFRDHTSLGVSMPALHEESRELAWGNPIQAGPDPDSRAPPRGMRGTGGPILGPPLTERIWSPLRSSPLRSAGPPARMKEMNMPSPSSPPTMLKPRPVEPRWITMRRGSLLATSVTYGDGCLATTSPHHPPPCPAAVAQPTLGPRHLGCLSSPKLLCHCHPVAVAQCG